MNAIPKAVDIRAAFDGEGDLAALGIHDQSDVNGQLVAVAKRAIEQNYSAMEDLVGKAETEERDLLASEYRTWKRHEREMCELRHLIEMNQIDRSSVIATGATMRKTTENDVLTRSDSFADWTARAVPSSQEQSDVRLGSLLRSWVTGNRDGLNSAEARAMSEGTASAGGVTVPTPTAARLIDLARNQARVIQAGAVVVPMTSQTLKMPRLTGASAPAWRNENAQIASGDLTLDAVTFTARSLAFEVKVSRELLEDSDPNIGGVIEADLAAQVALELDRVALRGSGTSPEPKGVLNQAGVTITAHGTNGTSISELGYDALIDAEGVVSAANHTPTGTILAPAIETGLRKARGVTDGQYLLPPAGMVARYQTNQIPTDLTVGTSTDCSEVYTADWSNLMIGMRTGPMVIQLVERYADMGQLGFIVWVRADVQLAHPEAFHVDTGVRP